MNKSLPQDAGARYYSVRQIGEEAGVLTHQVMKVALEMGLVTLAGQSNAFGCWKMTKVPYSSHECSQWNFSEAGRQRVLRGLQDAT